MNTGVKTAGKALEMLKPFPSYLGELTREGVKSYVDAQRALMDVMVRPDCRAQAGGRQASREAGYPREESGGSNRLIGRRNNMT